MAASKKTAKGKGAAGAQAAMTVSTAAFKHGASAYGARFVKKGFGFNEQEDLEWALGWPHVRRLVDGHPADAKPLSFLVGASFSKDSRRSDCVSLLGFLFLRLPEPVRTALEQRLRKVLEAVVDTIPGGLAEATSEPWHLPYRSIDRVLNGQKGVQRLGRMLSPRDLLLAEDPEFIVDWLRKRPGPGDHPALARLVFLGGEDVLDIEATWWKKYDEPRDEAQKIFVQDYARIRSEKMLAIFLAMSQTSKARKEAAAWFAAHADHARPYLERIAAGKGAAAKWAMAIAG
jgi:hypothetical protein